MELRQASEQELTGSIRMVPGGPGTPSEPGRPGRPGGPWRIRGGRERWMKSMREHIMQFLTVIYTVYIFIYLLYKNTPAQFGRST